MNHWTEAITDRFRDLGHDIVVDSYPLDYDDFFFDHVRLEVDDYVAAAEKLLDSWLITTVGNRFRRAERPRGLWDVLSY
ncbi:unnamed protein product, partial [marine sediment metagenome]